MNGAFLTSNRFWAVVVAAVVLYLNNKGILGVNETVLLETVLAGFVTVRTVDRFGEKAGSKDTK